MSCIDNLEVARRLTDELLALAREVEGSCDRDCCRTAFGQARDCCIRIRQLAEWCHVELGRHEASGSEPLGP